jgi:predicted metalloprotease with PDZ domain
MKLKKLVLFILFVCNISVAKEIKYELDLKNLINEKAKVTVSLSEVSKDTVFYVFAKTIPGTYSTLDYGKYIDKMIAFDKEGKKLTTVRQNENVFKIFPANSISKIEYWVKGSWKNRTKKNPIFEPAGTHLSKNVSVVNSGGFFGYIKGERESKINLKITKEKNIFGTTSLIGTNSDFEQNFIVSDFQKLIDNPILFCEPDTVSFFVSNTKVTISCFSENKKKVAGKIYEKLKPSMYAIEKFLGKLPVENYTFLIYIKDYSNLGIDTEAEKISIFKAVKALPKLLGKGFGALEHNQSSFYYLPDFGKEKFYLDMFESTAIHEFMHIVTPLNLHSKEIGEFDFIEPKMSKHLWLYEGATEYFAGIIRAKNGLLDTNKYLRNVLLNDKIVSGERFPYKKMSFTQMSKNVLENPYKKQYGQVYERGAALCAILDLEIMNSTNSSKTLRDVIITLIEKYGKDKSFDDETFFTEFSDAAGVDLSNFFNKYISGNDSIPYGSFLSYAGISYYRNETKNAPLSIDKMEGFKIKKRISIASNPIVQVKKAGKAKSLGIKKGDKFYQRDVYLSTHKSNGEYLPEGSESKLKVIRNEKEIEISFKVVYSSQKIKYEIINPSKKTDKQQVVFNKWFSN